MPLPSGLADVEADSVTTWVTPSTVLVTNETAGGADELGVSDGVCDGDSLDDVSLGGSLVIGELEGGALDDELGGAAADDDELGGGVLELEDEGGLTVDDEDSGGLDVDDGSGAEEEDCWAVSYCACQLA